MSWHDRAACAGKWHLFDADDQQSRPLAVAVCDGCPVRGECYDDWQRMAPDQRRYLVRFGMTANQRRRTLREGRVCGDCHAPVGPRRKVCPDCLAVRDKARAAAYEKKRVRA